MINTIDIGTVAELRNDYPINIVFVGATYPSVEHAFQAAKNNDSNYRKKLQDPNLSARDAKKLGRDVELRNNWDEIKEEIMLSLVRQKFFSENGKDCKGVLLSTLGKSLVMNHPTDKFWGVDLNIVKSYRHTDEFFGNNVLGYILEQVRRELALVFGGSLFDSDIETELSKDIAIGVKEIGQINLDVLLNDDPALGSSVYGEIINNLLDISVLSCDVNNDISYVGGLYFSEEMKDDSSEWDDEDESEDDSSEW